ncbi:MAG: FAD-dependent oxidoreductase [Terrimicrobiaceae bacterium]
MTAFLNQSPCEIPLIAEVDVLVVGGSSGAVAAASRAAKSGQKVFLVAPRGYLGEDLCGTFRLWPREDSFDSELAKPLFATVPPDPLHIKFSLQRTLIGAGIPFLLETFVTEVLRDDPGQVCGVEFVNKSGRQAIRAKVIIDATPHAGVAHLAGVPFVDRPGASLLFQRTVIGGKIPSGIRDERIVDIRPTPTPIVWKENRFVGTVYTLRLPLPDRGPASFAQAEQTARDMTWHKEQAFASEQLYYVPTWMLGDAREDASRQAGPVVPAGAFCSRSCPQLVLLNGCGAVSQERASQILEPAALIALGEKIGAMAAEFDGRLGEPSLPSVGRALSPTAPLLPGEASVPAVDLREPQFVGRKLGVLRSAPKALPVFEEVDVLVVGGGTGGAASGIGAARHGARTLMIEFLHGLGGVGTLGMINRNWYGNTVGFTAEVDRAVGFRDGSAGLPSFEMDSPPRTIGFHDGHSEPAFTGWHVEDKMEWLRSEFCKAGGLLWLHSTTCGVLLDGNTVCGVIAVTPWGRGVIRAKVVIDATGNADVIAAGGGATRFMGGEVFALQGVGLSSRDPLQHGNNSDWGFVNDSDGGDRTRMQVTGNTKWAGTAFDVSPLIASRERRSAIGDYTLTSTDIFRKRVFADGICIARDNFDQHGYTVDPLLRFGFPGRKKVIEAILPYRCLLPVGLENIFATALGVSVDRDALPVVRPQPDIQNQGFAAGIAAALAVREGGTIRDLDIRILQKRLIELGALPAGALDWKETPKAGHQEVLEALQTFSAHDNETDLTCLQCWATVFDAPKDLAIREVRIALHAARNPDKAVWMAIFLAEHGQSDACETLLEYLEAHPEWDEGWIFRGMHNHGSGYSRDDSVILALGTAKERRALPALLERLEVLTAESPFSHFHSLSLAFERIGAPEAAAALASKLLEVQDDHRLAVTFSELEGKVLKDEERRRDPNDNLTREHSLRTLLLARSLYRCGDCDGTGLKVLQQFADGLEGVYAKYARDTLASSPVLQAA